MDKKVLKLICIVGETASGKSALALDLAKRFNGELICADSWTVYKDFDIGTAKPTKLERAQVPHHLLDVADPLGGFSAAVFQELAQAAVNSIARRGKLPIMVGGTGLYIDSVLYHYSFLEQPTLKQREELNSLTLPELLARAEQRGLKIDGIDTRNKRRVIRLIENDGQLPTKKPLRPNTLILGLNAPREQLHKRIAARVDHMFESGLEKEVRQLAEQYGWDAEPMKGIGYREWQEYFKGTQSLEETRQKIIKATQDLAKRQRTWFKRNKSIHWLETPVDMRAAVDLTTHFLQN
jgi:tRNA dimethylallyltransferase